MPSSGPRAETKQPKPIYFKTGFEHNPAPAKKRARYPSHEWESGSARARQSQAHEQDYGKEPANKAKHDGSQGPESGQIDSDQPQSESESDAEIHDDVLSEQGTDEDLLKETEGELDEEEHTAVAFAFL